MKVHNKRVPDEKLVQVYKETGNVWKAGDRLGLCGQTVHERLLRLGIKRNNRPFTEEEKQLVIDEYISYRDRGAVNELAKKMNRTNTTLCSLAKKLGLTSYSHPRKNVAQWKYMDEEEAREIFERFKKSSLGVGRFCKDVNYSELGFGRTMRRFFPDEWEHVVEAKAPHQTMYRLGRAFEYRVRDLLKGKGFFVLRSPRSGSPVDLVAIRPGEVLFIQCKRSGVIVSREWNVLYDLAKSVGVTPLLAEMLIPRGIQLWNMTGRKDGTRKPQPRKEYIP